MRKFNSPSKKLRNTIKKSIYKVEKGCPTCLCPDFYSINIESFKNYYKGPFSNLFSLKHGNILECNSCKTIWFEGHNNGGVMRILKDQLDLVLNWDKRDLSLQPKHLKTLLQIGCSPSMKKDSVIKSISIPCKCSLKNGLIIENAVINLENKPPLFYAPKVFYYMDEVLTIEPSDLALSKEIRLETTLAKDAGKDYYPTVIIAPNKQRYIIEWPTDFFLEDEIMGCKMILPNKRKHSTKDAIPSQNEINGILIIANLNPLHINLFYPGYSIEEKVSQNSTLPKAGRTWLQKLFGNS